jgi:diguanylate cyclase (GGDEF)-like protein
MGAAGVQLLAVSANAAEAQMLRTALEKLAPGEFELTCARSLDEATVLLQACLFDVVLLDVALPDTPLENLISKLHQAALHVPLLLLTPAEQAGQCAQAVEEGVQDYLVKECLTGGGLLRSLRDAQERGRSLAGLSTSLLDCLTGLPTREGLQQLAAHVWSTPGRLKKGLTLLYCDVGSYGWIKESFGLPAGERILVATANILRRTFRASDLRGRLGEDEFAVLAVGAPEPTAPILIARLERSVQAHNRRDVQPCALSLSVGLAHADPQQPRSFEELLKHASSRLHLEPWVICPQAQVREGTLIPYGSEGHRSPILT